MQKRLGGKCIVFVDRVILHCSKITRKYVSENKDKIKLEYLPVGCLEFNATEECWRQGKYNIISCYYPTFDYLKYAISSYYRNRKFNLDVIKYFTRSMDQCY
ncbi:MAG: transposase [Nitrososphaeraceae archaeon]